MKRFFSENGKRTHEEPQDYGRFFPKMVTEFANEHLFHAKGLNVIFAPETEQQSERRQEMSRETR